MKRILIVELWGIGDATMMTSVLQTLLAENWEVTILGKPHTRVLLQPVYSQVKFMEFDAPWTAFRGKYRLWLWPWREIIRVISGLRRQKFNAAVSIRSDPRDHLLMWLVGAQQRIGFDHVWSRWLLNKPILNRNPNAHRVEDWWRLQDRILESAEAHLPPRLTPDLAIVERFRSQFGASTLPIIALHCGARIAVRRWPEDYYRQVIVSLRQKFNFRLVLIPDPDGYGNGLQGLADYTCSKLSLPELLALLSCATELICNDSGPAHLAAALEIPVTVLFGPTKPEWFRPFGSRHLVVIRDICPFRPCMDYCKFPENYCLTKLQPNSVYPEIEQHLIAQKRLLLR